MTSLDPATSDADELKDYVAGELERVRQRSARSHDPDPRRRRADPPALAADVPRWSGTSRTSATTRSCGCCARPPASTGDAPGVDDLYDAFEHPRAERPTCRCCRRPRPARTSATCAREVLDVLDAVAPRPAATRCWPTASSTAWSPQHEHQHDETMLATHQLAAAPACSTPPTAPPAPADAGRAAAARCSSPAGGSRWAPRPTRGRYDNERPRHGVDVAGVLDRHHAGHQRRVPRRSSTPAATTTRGGGAPAGWRLASGGRADARPRSGCATAAAGCAAGSAGVEPLPGDEPVQHVCWYEADAYARWAGPPAADRGRVGEGRRLGPARRSQAPLPVGRRRPGAGARQPRPAPPPARPGRRATRPAPRRTAPAR